MVPLKSKITAAGATAGECTVTPMAGSDVTVIGAGLYGSTLACALAHEGMRVRLLERDRPAGGDTGRSFGMVRRHYSNAVTVALARRGCELLAADRESAFVPTGYLV